MKWNHASVASAAAFLVFVTSALAAIPELPNDFVTPGVSDPSVTHANIKRTICVSGWTKPPRRLPTSYTNSLKSQQLADWHYNDKNMAHYEEDHRVPLEVGGDPRDPKNLWPKPYNTTWHARINDKLETFVKRQICARKMTLDQGQAVFKGNWVDAFQSYCGNDPTASCKAKP